MADEKMLQEDGPQMEAYKPIKISEARLDSFVRELDTAMDMTVAHRRAKLEDMAEASSEFPILLGGVINRMLLAAYKTEVPVWRKFTRTKSVADFRNYEVIKTWGTSTLDLIPEYGEYKGFARSEGKYSGTMAKYGKMYGVSWEMLINDNLGGFGEISNILSDMAIYTEWALATSIMTAAAGPHTSLFGAAISDAADASTICNLGALPLTIPNLETTLTLMKSQLDKNGRPMIVVPKYLVVPQALEYTARVILNSSTVLATGLASTSASTLRGQNNVLPQEGLELIVNPWLTQIDVSGKKNATWYVFGDGKVPSMQMTYLQGYEAPQLAMKSNSIQGGSVTEGSFENDSIWYRIRHCMGILRLDPRGCYAQTGS